MILWRSSRPDAPRHIAGRARSDRYPPRSRAEGRPDRERRRSARNARTRGPPAARKREAPRAARATTARCRAAAPGRQLRGRRPRGPLRGNGRWKPPGSGRQQVRAEPATTETDGRARAAARRARPPRSAALPRTAAFPRSVRRGGPYRAGKYRARKAAAPSGRGSEARARAAKAIGAASLRRTERVALPDQAGELHQRIGRGVARSAPSWPCGGEGRDDREYASSDILLSQPRWRQP